MISKVFVLASIIISAISIVNATEDSCEVRKLNRMDVKADRGYLLGNAMLDSSMLVRSRGKRTLDDVFENVVGIDMLRESPTSGKGKSLFIRGFNESRSLIVLNGRPLNGAGVMGADYVDWSTLSSENVREIEVLRGAKSAEYGNALGGVIAISTKRDMNAPTKTAINGSYGVVSPMYSEDFFENRLVKTGVNQHVNIYDRVALDMYAGYSESQPFLRNNYGKLTTYGSDVALILPYDILVALSLRNAIQYRGFAIENSKDKPDYYNDAYPESAESAGGGPGIKWKGGEYYFGDRSYWKNIRTQIDISLEREFENLCLSGRFYINDQDRFEYFYARSDTNKLVLERFTKPEDHTFGWNLKANQSLGDKHLLKYGVEGVSLRYCGADIGHIDTSYFLRNPEDWNPDETVNSTQRYSVYVQSYLKFVECLMLTPGVRFDYFIGKASDLTVDDTPLIGVSPNLGICFDLWDGGRIALHGAYANRFPTCPELYWYYNGFSFDDRKDLLAERAIQSEIGLEQELRWNKVQFDGAVRGYYYQVHDYLRTIFGYRPSRLIYNIDCVDFLGIEVELGLKINDALQIQTNYTFQTTEKTGDNFDSSMALSNSLPELSKHKANAIIEYHSEKGFLAGLTMRFVGERDIIEGNIASGGSSVLTHIDPFFTIDLSATIPLIDVDAYSVNLRLGITNLLNCSYEEQAGMPMPGITPTMSVNAKF